MAEYLDAIAIIISSTAAVLAWIAKLKWSKEFADAKNAVIASKDAQIETLKLELDNLRQLSPPKLREYYVSMKQQLEEYNEMLQTKLSHARSEADTKTEQIESLQRKGEVQSSLLSSLQRKRDELQREAELSQAKIEALSDIAMKMVQHLGNAIPENERGDKVLDSIINS